MAIPQPNPPTPPGPQFPPGTVPREAAAGAVSPKVTTVLAFLGGYFVRDMLRQQP
jgi:hypothetical protein